MRSHRRCRHQAAGDADISPIDVLLFLLHQPPQASYPARTGALIQHPQFVRGGTRPEMQLTVVTATGKRLSIQVADQVTAAALKAAVATALSLPPGAGLRLVRDGQLLAGDEAASRLQNGDTLLAAVVPRPPPKAVRELVSGAEEEEEDEVDTMLRLRLPANAPRWKRGAAHLLHRRLCLPEALVALLLAVSLRFWLGLAAWMAGAKLAAGYEAGPLYIITTIFLLMFLNLGKRKEGEWSAYSIFNRNMQRLPGQMTAEDLDAAVRRGQL